jgi:hypothetical protein
MLQYHPVNYNFFNTVTGYIKINCLVSVSLLTFDVSYQEASIFAIFIHSSLMRCFFFTASFSGV